MIRWMALAAVGLGVAAIGSVPLFEASKSVFGETDGPKVSASSPVVSGAAEPAAPVTVKVVYFQMPQIVENRQEYFVLRSPADFGELMQVVTSKHPALAEMRPNMMILIDGNVAKAGSPLNDGDEVDFIPAYAGG
jgi:molybdopterin converting factor small subunit